MTAYTTLGVRGCTGERVAYTPSGVRGCTGERQPLAARIGGHYPWPFTRTPGAYTCSDQGKRPGVRASRTPATQKPPLTRGNTYRSPVHPYGADPKVSDHGPPGGRRCTRQVYAPIENQVYAPAPVTTPTLLPHRQQ